MEIITYSLRNDQARSDQYYRDVAAFSDRVLAEAESQAGPLMDAFGAYLQQSSHKTASARPELVFELLTLGVLWQVYARKASGSGGAPQQVLAGLARLRETKSIKPAVDLLRGVLMALFLPADHGGSIEPLAPTLDHLARLLDWLEATGNFSKEVKRLRPWRDFLASQPPAEAARSLTAAIAFAAWFESSSVLALGPYTPHVEQFLAETHPHYRWREDYVFCGRQRVEYHLNMVGTELLNRAFREAFLRTTQRIVILPPCMKAKQDECQARPAPLGARCAGCTPGCRVRQVTALGEKHDFAVFIMPDELSVFSGGPTTLAKGDAPGVVGVSCVLTNAPGGWETQDLGVPAQGVLLDYCGCKWHWHPKGIPTDINTGQLVQVTGADNLGSS